MTDGTNSFAIFNYLQIKWTTGIADGGNATGLGGTPAQVSMRLIRIQAKSNDHAKTFQVGFDAGDGINYYALPQSQTNDIVNIGSMSNLNPPLPGKFIFQINGADIHNLPSVTLETCRATTDPHFTTFDGAYYSPQEQPGSWFLAAAPVTVPDNTLPWSVWFSTSYWNGLTYATCITSVQIVVADQVIEFGMNGFLRVTSLN